MLKLFKQISIVALITSIFISFAPLTFAQSDLTSPLDDIKAKLESEGIEVIDYSENKWGRLPDRLINALEESDLIGDIGDALEIWPDEVGFAEIYKYMEVLVEGAHTNIAQMEEAMDLLTQALLAENEEDEPPIFSSDDIELIKYEILAYQFHGERQLRDVVRQVAVAARNLIAGLAIIWIIVSGVRMVMAGGDESVITEQKRSIIYAVIGLAAILLVERMIDIIYGPAGSFRDKLDPATTTAFSLEVYGVVNFIKAIIGSIAIFMIVLSGIKTIFAFGQEEQLTKQKKAVLWIVIGLVLLIIDKVIVEQIFVIPTQQQHDQISASNITTVINVAGRVLQFVLGFVGLIALGMLVYGAGMMIANYGNDEVVQKAKKVIRNAIIGIIVIISAYTIVATLIVFK